MLQRALGFLLRHRISLPLALLSAGAFAELADEMHEGHVGPFDETIAELLTGFRGPLDLPMLALTHLGDWPIMAFFAVFVVVALFRRGHRRQALFFATAASGALLIFIPMKILFGRARPNPAGYLIPNPDSYSFPSGHAMASAGVIGSLLVLCVVMRTPRAVRVPALIIGTLCILGVGASRVYFGVHFASDVIGGQLAAAAWISAVTGWFYPRLLPGEETIEPAPHV